MPRASRATVRERRIGGSVLQPVVGPQAAWHDPAVTWLHHALAALALLFAVLWLRARSAVGRGNARRGARARRAEHDAEALLLAGGYRILDRQRSEEWPMDVDGARVQAALRADLLVERDGLHYVAEVKSGRETARPTHPHTRRQLLEYLLAFDVDGVLLVDMVRGRVVEVEFPAVDLR
jgi:hypothetical protein